MIVNVSAVLPDPPLDYVDPDVDVADGVDVQSITPPSRRLVCVPALEWRVQ